MTQLVAVREATDHLHLSEDTVESLARREELSTIRFGRAILCLAEAQGATVARLTIGPRSASEQTSAIQAEHQARGAAPGVEMGAANEAGHGATTPLG